MGYGRCGHFALLYNITIQGTDMMDAENKGAWGQIMNQMTKFAILPIAMLFPNIMVGRIPRFLVLH